MGIREALMDRRHRKEQEYVQATHRGCLPGQCQKARHQRWLDKEQEKDRERLRGRHG